MNDAVDAGLDRLLARRVPGQTFTLEEIGRATGLSRERIRQIEARALSKLQRRVIVKRLYEEWVGEQPPNYVGYWDRENLRKQLAARNQHNRQK